MKEEIRDLLYRLTPFLLSHHPMCSFFDRDTYQIFGRRVCLGCSLTYPIAILTVLFFFLFDLHHNILGPLFHESILLASSLLLGSLQALKYSSDTGNKIFHIIAKISLGLSIGGLAVWTLLLPVFWPLRLAFLFAGILFIMFLGSLRIPYMRRICAGCVYHGDWDICYGFRGLNSYHYFRTVRDKKRIERLIFDRRRKMEAPKETGPPASIYDRQPPLKDDERWLVRNRSMDIPWLPGKYR